MCNLVQLFISTSFVLIQIQTLNQKDLLTQKMFKIETAIRKLKKEAKHVYSQPKEGQKPLKLHTFLQKTFQGRFSRGGSFVLTFTSLFQDLDDLGLSCEPCRMRARKGYPLSFFTTILSVLLLLYFFPPCPSQLLFAILSLKKKN